ncbi:MAG: hypothetical protein ACI8RA_001976, partial [Chlamydiales bacterium]
MDFEIDVLEHFLVPFFLVISYRQKRSGRFLAGLFWGRKV